MAVSTAAAVAIYRWSEQPILRALSARFIARRAGGYASRTPAASVR